MDRNKKIIIITVLISFMLLVLLAFLMTILNMGTLIIESNPDKARISITGKRNNYNTPAKIKLKAGEYKVSAVLDNYPSQEVEVVVKRREITSIKFDLTQTNGSPNTKAKFSSDDPIFTNQLHFKVDFPDDENSYDFTISLYATLNGSSNPEEDDLELKSYYQELKDYKKEAVDWLIKNGADPSDYKIQWIPPEAANIE